MYQCRECHVVFDVPDLSVDEATQPEAVCPDCGSYRIVSLPDDDPREER